MDIVIEFDSDNGHENFNDNLSKNVALQVITAKQFKTLEKFKIYFFFDKRLPIWFDRYNARIYPIDYPSFNYFVSDLGYESLKERISSGRFDFVIHIERKRRKHENEILKFIDIAHELQHIVQYRNNVEIFCKSDVLFQASKVLNDNLLGDPDPLEAEAIKVSKEVSYSFCGKYEVDSFAQRILKNPNALEDFWKYFGSIDIDRVFDPIKEIDMIWTQNMPKIEEIIMEINNRLDNSKEDILFRNRFEFCCKTTQEHQA
jgi:hypothetical protein